MATKCCSNHSVFFYTSESEFPDALHSFFTSAVESGSPMVLVMTKAHRALFENYMRAHYLDPKTMESVKLLVQLDADETLDSFFNQGTFNKVRFKEVVGGVLSKTQQFHAKKLTWAYGEMVDQLCKRGL